MREICGLAGRLGAAVCLGVLLIGGAAALGQAAAGQDAAAKVGDLSARFWEWRATEQPFTDDDIPRIDRPAGFVADWSAAAVATPSSAGSAQTRSKPWVTRTLSRAGWATTPSS